MSRHHSVITVSVCVCIFGFEQIAKSGELTHVRIRLAAPVELCCANNEHEHLVARVYSTEDISELQSRSEHMKFKLVAESKLVDVKRDSRQQLVALEKPLPVRSDNVIGLAVTIPGAKLPVIGGIAADSVQNNNRCQWKLLRDYSNEQVELSEEATVAEVLQPPQLAAEGTVSADSALVVLRASPQLQCGCTYWRVEVENAGESALLCHFIVLTLTCACTVARVFVCCVQSLCKSASAMAYQAVISQGLIHVANCCSRLTPVGTCQLLVMSHHFVTN